MESGQSNKEDTNQHLSWFFFLCWLVNNKTYRSHNQQNYKIVLGCHFLLFIITLILNVQLLKSSSTYPPILCFFFLVFILHLIPSFSSVISIPISYNLCLAKYSFLPIIKWYEFALIFLKLTYSNKYSDTGGIVWIATVRKYD